MKRMTPVLMFAMLFPTTIIAQQDASNPESRQSDTTGSVQMAGPPMESPSASTEGKRDLNLTLAFPQQSKAPQKPPKPSKPASDIKPPNPEGSMVGYIDNAIVGSQIRMRFDAGFDIDSPDRAEFFYAKCGCYRALNGTGLQAAFDPNAPGPGTGIPTALNFQQLRFNLEYAPLKRFSVFADVPFRWIQPQGFVPASSLPFTPTNFGNQGGIGDFEAGFKLAAVTTRNTYLTFQFRTYFPTGDSYRGLGTAHYSVEPSVLYYQKLTDRWSAEAQLGDWHPIGGSAGVPTNNTEGFAGDIFTYGIGPSYQVYRGERVRIAPVVEMVGWRVLGGFQSLQPGFKEVGGMNIVNIKGGVRTSIGNNNSFYIGFGQAVTHDVWYKHIIRFEYRYSF
jgi:hypothetical protein